MDRYLRPHEIVRRYSISVGTLRRWAEDGKLDCRRMPGGKRLYRMADVARILGDDAPMEAEAAGLEGSGEPVTRRVCYARVSSAKQRPDLVRQIDLLRKAYPDAEILYDIGSGLNWKRPHFLALLERSQQGQLDEVVVAHKDRLCRFAFELVAWMLDKFGVRLVVLGECEPDRDELADDLLSIVNVFVARHNGMRSAANYRKRKAEAKEKEKEGRQKKGKRKREGKPSRGRKHRAPDTDESEEGEDPSHASAEDDDRHVDRGGSVDL